MPNGAPAASESGNRAPLASTKRSISGFNEDKREIFNGALELDYDVPTVPGLSASTKLSYVFRSEYVKNFDKTFDVYKYNFETEEYILQGTNGDEGLDENFERYQQVYPQVRLDYKREFGKHEVEGLALAEWIVEDGVNIGASRRDLLSTNLPYLFVGSEENLDNYGNAYGTGRASYVSRLRYDYDDKYILEGTFRADASHKFPKDSRWGYFPSISAAWRISEEPFLQNKFDVLDDLKLRASYSHSGDDDVAAFQYLTGFNISNASYLVDDEVGRVITPSGLPNPNITWLDITLYNAGFDASFWNAGLELTFNAFYRRVDNIFGTPQQSFPSTFGASLPQLNINTTDDRGVDFEIAHKNTIGEVGYSISGNFTYAREKYVDWAEENYEDPDEKRLFQNEGNFVNRDIGYVSDGLFMSQEEIDNHEIDQDQNGNSTLIPGDIRYKDLNGDSVITFRDQKVIGYGSQPDLSFGMNLGVNYKGLSVSALFQGASMYSLYAAGNVAGTFLNGSIPLKYHYNHRYTPDAKNPKLPASNFTGNGLNDNNSKHSDFWNRNVTYVRLKRFNIGYDLPSTWLESVGLRQLRVYASGSNLFTFDNLGIFSKSFDPENSIGQRSYPLVRTVAMGVKLSL